ncbi:transcriptional regulator [Mycobacterium riyadhense]|nr:transcriptional regulator [Mycobacterium riyadhense]
MVRYYTARGLLPRPGTRGRALTFGRTHLLCLVAIKRLQGQGLSLDEIAERLDGMAPAEVESLAAIPHSAMPPDLGDPDTPAPSRAAGRFWRDPPASNVPAPAVTNLQAVRLSDTVTLLIDGDSLPALDSLRRAAAPLLDLLANSRKDAP